MCGIHAIIEVIDGGNRKCNQDGIATSDALSSDLRDRLTRRGPDHLGQVAVSSSSIRSDGKTVSLCFTSTVLALRGDGLTKQPFVDSSPARSVLCWNGEVWRVDGAAASVDGNDGQELFERLTAADDALSVLRAVEGPFAFVYYDGVTNRLFYGRDRLGRRSMLQQTTGDRLTLSSVSDVPEDASASTHLPWTEVEADGVYVMDLQHDHPLMSIVRHDWSDEFAGDSTDNVVSGLGRSNMASDPGESGRLTVDSQSVQELRDQLTASLRLRALNVPIPPAHAEGIDTRIAVLFSGGLDCTVLARLAHDVLPPEQGIDLINVAFENPRVKANLKGNIDVYEACPDRITGRASWAELQQTCPARAWRFLAVNVPYTEFVKRRPTIVALMHPHDTEMDLSIASALYFAARGQTGREETPARVLLSGLGADELFGGYGRHAIAYKVGAAADQAKNEAKNNASSGYAALAAELHLDVARLGRRNLGRDDRVFAHWGREVRFPFLDEQLVRWAIALPAWTKCDFGSPFERENEVEPAKRVLRLVAQSLELLGVAHEKKRAIQFGARTAKMESGRVKGTARVI
ncbi:hypothetical protein SEUCBS140593_008548 [Sporothrix eucalyptigena]|uniref:Glutamine amidotransferase type-2 domain-containing protein n=1 Tax=Sporothrix eucalyptigena TaxID=1812306 RepID=A0ABP0CPZ9_9PEZI